MQIQTLALEFGQLVYYRTGPVGAPALLGLSGFGCNHYNYIDLLPELSKSFQIILIDNRGMGKSGKTKAEYSLKDVASDALAVIDDCKIDKFGLMGISMGGFIAQELVALAPQRVSALALMCTLSSGPDFIHPVSITEEGLRQFNTLDVAMRAEFSTMATVHPELKEKFPETYKRIVNLRIDNIPDLEETIRQNTAAVNFINAPFDLSIVTCPTLAMAGAEDRFVNPENIKAFAKNIKKTQTALIPESDHFFFLEKPVEVAENLHRFFKEVL